MRARSLLRRVQHRSLLHDHARYLFFSSPLLLCPPKWTASWCSTLFSYVLSSPYLITIILTTSSLRLCFMLPALFSCVSNLCITYPTISITQYPWHLYSLVSFLVFCSALLPSKSLLSPIHPAQLFLLYSSVLSIVTLSATSVIIGRFQYYTVDCVICLMPFALSSEIHAPVYINLKYGGANFKEFEWWDPSRTHL